MHQGGIRSLKAWVNFHALQGGNMKKILVAAIVAALLAITNPTIMNDNNVDLLKLLEELVMGSIQGRYNDTGGLGGTYDLRY
jgi:hypothetical protein